MNKLFIPKVIYMHCFEENSIELANGLLMSFSSF